MIDTGQITSSSAAPLSTSVSAPLLTVPPGPTMVVISNTSGGVVYVSAGNNAATSSNGFAIPDGAPPVMFMTYEGSTGSALEIIADGLNALTGPVSWLISTTG